MIFNSFSFLVFMIFIFFMYYILPEITNIALKKIHKRPISDSSLNEFHKVLLLVSSYYFYMSWNTNLIILILFTTLVSFFCAILINNTQQRRMKIVYLIFNIACSLGVLFFFKYFNFFSENFTLLFQRISIPISIPLLEIILPIGISFYTFQTLSYTIDVYKGSIDTEKNIIDFSLYVAYFPQLVAGPIERPSRLLPQFKIAHRFDYNLCVYGMKLMAWGFFKKIAIADFVSRHVDLVYNDVYSYNGFSLAIATILFAIQIYCDFSGYTDIAIGCSNMLGIELMKNFNSPYMSSSIKEFWDRWHISLSTWFRDYVYIPLGGNRKGMVIQCTNLLITFVLSGLWHGTNWTFIIWGFYNGVLIVVQTVINMSFKKIRVHEIISIPFTFALVCVGWMVFRANSIQDAIYILENTLNGFSNIKEYVKLGMDAFDIDKIERISILIPIVILFLFDFYNMKYNVIQEISKLNLVLRWCMYLLIVFITFLYLPAHNIQTPFIYFQF